MSELVVLWAAFALAGVLVVTARARARRRAADRWAAMVGIQRMPAESSSDLVRRVADRLRIR